MAGRKALKCIKDKHQWCRPNALSYNYKSSFFYNLFKCLIITLVSIVKIVLNVKNVNIVKIVKSVEIVLNVKNV